MFAQFAAFIRRQATWAQFLLWPVFGAAHLFVWLGKAFLWIAERLGELVTRSARSFFGNFFRWTGRGTFAVITVKIAGILLAVGCVLVGVGATELGGGFMALAMIPIMVLAIVIMVTSPFRR